MTDRLDYRAIGSRVRELRLQHKMTQEYLAELVDISPSFIDHIERGEKKPSLETICFDSTMNDTGTAHCSRIYAWGTR